jgi:hypothetical protein
MFYNVMRAAMSQGHHVEDVFGDQNHYYRHAFLKAARHCDAIFAVGDYVLKEIRFLAPEFAHVDSQLAYNGVPCWPITVEEKTASRNRLRQYCKNLLKYEPDYVFTHVTRLVPSKGLWRDLRVLEHLEQHLRERNETAVLFSLSTEVPQRRGDDIRRMEQHYHWPVVHREGLPDMSSGEAVYYQGVQEFNAFSRNIKVVFLNQFGFEPKLCGARMPADMEFMDIRKGSDAEFGQAIYEPFGISPVEPISFGGICVFTNVCGCAGFVEKAAGGPTPNAIVANYTDLPLEDLRPEQLMAINQVQRDQIEHQVAERVAMELIQRLPRSPKELEQSIARGYSLAQKMSWDAVARDYVLPGIKRATRAQRLRQIA